MYPQSNSARSVRDLSGVWDFRFNADEPWQPIAVPASYNDQSPDPEFRRHYGMAYYRTTFTVPEGARRVLRFDAVTHNAVVRLNGQEIASHRGGFLPFEADITALAQPGETVTLDVEVDNRIGHSSLPVGNEGGTAFFGSDNAGIPAVEAGKAVLVTSEVNENVVLSARNIPGVVTTTAKLLSVYDIVNAKQFIVDKAALAVIEEVFA